MTVNVEELVKQLGECYQDIKDKGLIPYKVKPSGGDEDDIFINLEQHEGLFLSFDNDEDKKLNEITLVLEDEKKTDWLFPNIMPFKLEPVMTQAWVRAYFGIPMCYGKPKLDGPMSHGANEIYSLFAPHQHIAVQFKYDFSNFVKTITFYSIEHAKEIVERVEKLRLEGLDV